MNDMWMIRVPASTSNLGPGFDSIGMAVDRFLELTVTPADQWFFKGCTPELESLPTGKDNLLYEVADKLARAQGVSLEEFPHHVAVDSNIPLARGLGSSASAIVAAIELVNQIGQLNLSKEEKLRIASLEEGHLDNVAASVYGGLIIGSHREECTDLIHIDKLDDIAFVAVIPTYELKTSESRKVLQDHFSRQEAVEASSVANTLVAALCTTNWVLAGKMMELDLFHEKARSALVPELQLVRKAAKAAGAYGTFLSGAGPTTLSMVPVKAAQDIAAALHEVVPNAEVTILKPELQGATVCDMKEASLLK
ncbi:homoserine kinase [Aureibacillus halotolerans]|uniref:Homoserine kinase n=1 Tax=Aureibacillus halotolerans TaxID=1508390 RepID=A0A4R6U796_9BACI|nr:homoserine kinase [Aureibacillus halotolerans]TDQ40435.1 homoserine kinase [Aureibacillus halotolerans]